MRWKSIAVIVLLSIQSVVSCPQEINEVCRCEENNNGIRLDCSNTNGAEIVQLLKRNQVQLGLMQSLVMKNASLQTISENFFEGLFIKQLDLSNNEISEIHEKAFEGMSNVITEIILSNNKLSKIPCKAISTQRNLFRLDLANNTIGDLRPDDVLPVLPKLFDVNLSGNRICMIQGAIFEKVKTVLQTLNLGRNCLSAVPSQAIRGQTQLQSLHLHHNNISSLEALSFLNLPVLQLLNLANNVISDINTQAFINVPNLRYMYLTGNRISKLTSHQFNLFERMEFLDLTKNRLETIPNGAFAEQSSLRQLYLGNNSITTIEKEAFTNSSIVILVISDNQITELGEDVVSGLPNLQQLSFKNNKIHEVHPNAFHNIPSTVVLDLSHNFISNLAPNTFLAQINLLFIDLSNNKLTKTPYAVLNRRIGTVVLKENPLVCTEKLHMVQDSVGMFVPNSEDKVCGSSKPTTTTTTTETPSLIAEDDGSEEVATETNNDSIPAETEAPAMNPLKIRPMSLNRTPAEASTRPILRPISHVQQSPEVPSPIVPASNGENTAEVKTAQSDVAASSPVDKLPTRPEDNPGRILPFPIPFLKMAPGNGRQVVRVLRPSAITTTTTTTAPDDEFSLPPSIIIAPNKPISDMDNFKATTEVNYQQFALRNEKADSMRIEAAPKISKNKSYPTTAIIICLSSVVVIMIIVFSILCAMRHRMKSSSRNYANGNLNHNFHMNYPPKMSSRRGGRPGLEVCDLY